MRIAARPRLQTAATCVHRFTEVISRSLRRPHLASWPRPRRPCTRPSVCSIASLPDTACACPWGEGRTVPARPRSRRAPGRAGRRPASPARRVSARCPHPPGRPAANLPSSLVGRGAGAGSFSAGPGPPRWTQRSSGALPPCLSQATPETAFNASIFPVSPTPALSACPLPRRPNLRCPFCHSGIFRVPPSFFPRGQRL